MKIEVVRTRKVLPPKDNLFEVIEESLKKFSEGNILAVASKVVAIHQGRTVKMGAGVDREKLAKREAQWYVDRDLVPGEHLLFTIKDNTLIASSGIDKSNSGEYFVLWPEEVTAEAREIQAWLKKTFQVSTCGVILVDSHVTPMRRGTLGISLGHWGFNPVKDYVGKEDIFGKKMEVTVKNIADGLAAAAVVAMGEGKEQTPLAVISDVTWVEFGEDEEELSLKISREEDLYRPLLSGVEWKKGGGE